VIIFQDMPLELVADKINATEPGVLHPSKGDVMATFAKLLFLEAKQIRDPDGADEIVVSRQDGVIFERIRLRKDEVFTFDDDRLLPFRPDQSPVVVILNEVNEAAHQGTTIGGASITADEEGRGEITSRIEGAGSMYELTYKVI
jgi:hypothetical protein